MDVPVAYLLRLNVRDSTVEDNVRKRPFPLRSDHPAPAGYQSQRQNYEKYVKQQRKLRKNLALFGKDAIFAASNFKFGYAAECGE